MTFVCAHPDCTRPPVGYGWCAHHYRQMITAGYLTDPTGPEPAAPEALDIPLPAPADAATPTLPDRPARTRRRSYTTWHEAYTAHVVPGEACWAWTGARAGASSSPVLRVGGESMPASRYAWEWLHGPLPEGRRLTNTCGHLCVNPAHYRRAHR